MIENWSFFETRSDIISPSIATMCLSVGATVRQTVKIRYELMDGINA